MHRHLVQFYEADGFLIDEVTHFIGDGLEAGEAGIVIATKPHSDALHHRLAAHLARPATRKATGRPTGPYICLDAEETLARFMVDGWPDEQRFREQMGGVIAKGALAGNGKIRAFGEMVAVLWQGGQRDAAIRLEDLWNELLDRQQFSLFCAYPMQAFSSPGDSRRLLAVCGAHSHVNPAESVMPSMNAQQLKRSIVQLQHKAAALESEARRRTELEKSLKSREAELKKRIEELARADARKNEFLAMLGHELRNPLAPIVNALELMRLAGEDPRRMDHAREIVERQAAMMKRIVDDLLDISRMANGKIDLQREKILLESVVQRAVEMARPLIDERGHRLTVELPAEPLPLDVDPLRLGQVIANLLNNAAKYTNRGGLISLTARKEGGQLSLSVRDNGIGLEPQLMEQVFELFVQGKDSPARSRGGLGIGLTLVRNIVQLHGGTVQAHSAGPGEGSEFVVRMPLPQPVIADAAVPTRRKTGATPRRKVLVVDDNVDAAETLAECLRFLKHEVRTAHDATSAIELAVLENPDLVILDIGLPGIDGYETARQLRALPQMKGALLVALTGYALEADVIRAVQSGFDHHLSKPLDFPRLTALLESPRRNRRTLAPTHRPHTNLQ